jgi:hypothetical protein
MWQEESRANQTLSWCALHSATRTDYAHSVYDVWIALHRTTVESWYERHMAEARVGYPTSVTGLMANTGSRTRKVATVVPGRQSVDPPLQLPTETWDDDSQNEPDFDADPAQDPTCNEPVPDIIPNAPPPATNPISPK